MSFRVKVDSRGVQTALDRLPVAIARNQRNTLPRIADQIIDDIKAGDWFDNDSNNLKKKLVRSKVRSKKSGAEIDMGWAGDAAVYGPVLEFGPTTKRSWVIRPKGVLAQGYTNKKGVHRAAGSPIKALRWTIGGAKGSSFGVVGVRYAKKVKINWSARSLRKHYAPVLKARNVWIKRQLLKAVLDAEKAVRLK